MAQQTAVNYLVEILSEVIDKDYYKKEIEQAKQMEKEQIMRANFDGFYERVHGQYITVERYYNEKYEVD